MQADCCKHMHIFFFFFLCLKIRWLPYREQLAPIDNQLRIWYACLEINQKHAFDNVYVQQSLAFISVQHTLYSVSYWTVYKSRKQAVSS